MEQMGVLKLLSFLVGLVVVEVLCFARLWLALQTHVDMRRGDFMGSTRWDASRIPRTSVSSSSAWRTFNYLSIILFLFCLGDRLDEARAGNQVAKVARVHGVSW